MNNYVPEAAIKYISPAGSGNVALFRKFVSYMDANEIDYVLLGKTKGLTEVIDSDVDLVVARPAFRRIYSIIQGFASRNQGLIVQVIEHESSSRCFVVAFVRSNKIDYLTLDVSYNYKCSGRTCLDEAFFLANTLKRPGAYNVLQPAHEFIYYFIKKLVKGTPVTETQYQHLAAQYAKSNKQELAKLLSEHVAANTIITNPKGSFLSLDELNKMLKEKRLSPGRTPVKALTDFLQEKPRAVRRFLKPTGFTVAFLGRDGSGKSSTIEYVQESLQPAARGITYFHLSPQKSRQNGAKEAPYQKPPRSLFLSFLKLTYFVARFNFKYLANCFLQLCSTRMFIFDRYYHDVLIDPERYRHKGAFIAKLYSAFIPKPDLWFVIDAPTEVVAKRTDELSFERSETLRHRYLAFAKRKQKATVIDTSDTVEQSGLNCSKAILTFLNNRVKERYQ